MNFEGLILKKYYCILKQMKIVKLLVVIIILAISAIEAYNGENFDIDSNTLGLNSREVRVVSTATLNDNDSIAKTFFEVIKVVDGDTIKVEMNGVTETIRLIGANTPESVDPRREVQCFGLEASKKTKDILMNKKIRLELDATQDFRDKYGRLLAYVFLEDGTNLNKRLIEEGYAYEYTYKLPYKYQNEFKVAQKYAESNKLGLWADGACEGKK